MKKLSWRKIIIIIVISIVTIVAIIYGVDVYKQYQLTQQRIDTAREFISDIQLSFKEENYEKAAKDIAKYQEYYSREAYSNLPDDLLGEVVYSEWEGKIGLALVEHITSLDAHLKEVDSKDWSLTDFEKLEDYLTVLRSYYPDGFNYTLDSGEKKHYPVVKNEIDDYLATVRYQKSIQLWDNGKKTAAIETMKDIVNSGSKNKTIVNKAESSLKTMIQNNPATDFEITGGSSCVYLMQGGRYGVICPNCGYDSGMMSVADLVTNISKHYAGEVVNTSYTFKCAGHLGGGCGKFSNYDLTIEYE